MRWSTYILGGCVVVVLVMLTAWLCCSPQQGVLSAPRPAAAGQLVEAQPGLRLGVVPERDVFGQRARYQALAQELSNQLGTPVQVVMLGRYDAVLADFNERVLDMAFLGSLMAVLAHDRCGAQVLVKPENLDGSSNYYGVVFVREDSPMPSLSAAADGCVAMVHGTMAGQLYPVVALRRAGVLKPGELPRCCWCATHDAVIAAVAEGTHAVGAAKDTRLSAYEKAHPQARFRRLAQSASVPDSALVARAGLDEAVRRRVVDVLLSLQTTEPGRAVLDKLGLRRFVPCRYEDYQPVYEMASAMGEDWRLLELGDKPR